MLEKYLGKLVLLFRLRIYRLNEEVFTMPDQNPVKRPDLEKIVTRSL